MAATYAQGMAYELARELISSRIGRVSHDIGIEEQKSDRDNVRISELEAELIEYGRERESLEPSDIDAVRSVIVRYSRTGTIPDLLSEQGPDA